MDLIDSAEEILIPTSDPITVDTVTPVSTPAAAQDKVIEDGGAWNMVTRKN